MRKIDPITFRHGLSNLRTRRFEIATGILIRKLINSKNYPEKLSNEDKSLRIQIKSSLVSTFFDTVINPANVLSTIAAAGLQRSVPYHDWHDYKFDCYIQQIKPSEFDILYYGLFFAEQIAIFRIKTSDLPLDQVICSTNRSYKSIKKVNGERFHLNNATLQYHIDKYLQTVLNYQQVINSIS